MNTYQAFYKGKQIEVQAESSYKAQLKAAAIFKAKRNWDVAVVIVAHEDGKPVIHSTNEF